MLEAPAILTKIDLWMKRKRSRQQILFLRGDRESILKWNLAILHSAKTNYVPDGHQDIEDSIIDLMNWLVGQLDNSTVNYFANLLWSSIDHNRIPEKDRTATKNLLEASLIIQVRFRIY